MNKLEANNWPQAQKELNKLDSELTKKVDAKINEKNKGYFHIILLKIISRANAVKNDVELIVQTYHKRGFEKLEKNYPYLGYSKLIVLHDPTKSTSQPATDPKDTRSDFEKLVQDGTIADMKDFAEKNEIDLGEASLKADIQTALNNWKEAQK